MPIDLLPLGTLTIEIDQHTVIAGTPAGTRIVGEALSCRWDSERVSARQHGKMAHDWLMLNADGSVSVDARLLLMTDDGAAITITYRGKAAKQPAEGGVLLTTPVFETGDERYLWLNGIQAVAKGVRDGAILTYEMYQLA
ncbi:MAG: DUF3237 domain-containing protein [Geodermatophilaceae bacterium]|nr:DUF3237 domain-containing protein [Geodermatophilaceae bacterium]MDQ3463559.1 DUF3237 domain-containing protein [Actinomycetota bacterium]